jgi:uncharacterized damage-inducible protein DinB
MTRRLLGVLLMTLFFASLSYGQALAPADRDRALKYLQTTKENVLAATKGLSEAQWNFKPGPDRWSVAEVMEHIAAAEDLLFDLTSKQVMNAPPRPDGDDVKAIDEIVLAKVPDRTVKQQAPESLKPTNRYGSPDAAVKHFVESRDKTIDFLRKTPDLRAHAIDSPVGKKLDAYQWILLIAAHSERHTKQINEVKADPNFPKG